MKCSVAIILAIACGAGTADASDREVVRVDDGVYLLRAPGATASAEELRRANAAFVVGPRGVVVVDSGISYRDGRSILAAVKKVTRRPVRLVILTQPEQEAIFGAAAFKEAGIPVIMHREAANLMASRCEACLRNLERFLGTDAMSGTRVIEPDRVVSESETIDAIGRRLRLIALAPSSAPGALAVLDERTSTLFAGNIVSIRTVPDTRDADARGWRDALATLASTRCRHLVPSFGAAGSCADIAAFARYLDDLEARVSALLREGTSLAELEDRCELPEYARWDRYGALHRANANRAYLRLEKAMFDMP